jgi:putative membrane protein
VSLCFSAASIHYNTTKSLHPIFCNTWFAGLFYIVRLFVYQIELPKTIARKEILQAQYVMTYRLWYIITWPSAILAYFCVLDAVFTDLGKAYYKCLGCM